MTKLTETTPPTMSTRQAALLVLVASILKKSAAAEDAKLLTNAIEDVAFELAALGIKPPA
jgi:hypothetical protein